MKNTAEACPLFLKNNLPMKKFVFVLFSLLSPAVWGQQQAGEFSAFIGGGLSHLKYSPGASSPKAGASAGLGYRYYFSPQWSIGSGAGLQLYNSRINLNQLSGSSPARDAEGSPFEFRYNAANYRESQTAFYLAVPLNVQFETAASETAWYIHMGGKVAYPVRARYQAEIPGLATTGYYPEWNVELAAPAFMGFGQWQNVGSPKRELKTKTAFLLTAETGIKRKGSRLAYIGVYADYGLNNILKAGDRSAVIRYLTDSPSQFSYRSVTTSLNGDGNPWAEKLNLFSLGIKLRMVLN